MPCGEGGRARDIYRGGTPERERERARERVRERERGGLSNEDRLLGDGPLFLFARVCLCSQMVLHVCSVH